jgi:hypothetical protein
MSSDANVVWQLMEGRRAAGGSLEVRLRVRAPLLAAPPRTTRHRWLVLH